MTAAGSPGQPHPAPHGAERRELAYAGALATLPRLGQPLLRRLLEVASAEECWRAVGCGRAVLLLRAAGVPPARLARFGELAGRWRCAAASVEPLALAEGWRAAGMTPVRVRPGSGLGALEVDPRAPALLFVLEGGRGVPQAPRVAVVGTRACTHYGASLAFELAAGLAGSGVQVVAGIEAGIEAAAISGALAGQLDAGAGPLALGAGGVEPTVAHGGGLARRLLATGAVASEAPPPAAAQRWRYFRRRLLLALVADVVVVVEAHARSGALGVAEAAAEAGVTVAAVPGSVRSAASAGTNALLADGAQLVRSADDVLGLLELGSARGSAARRPARSAGATLGEVESLVLAALEDTPTSLDLVLARTRLDLAPAASALEALVDAGLARPSGGCFERCSATPATAGGRQPGRELQPGPAGDPVAGRLLLPGPGAA